MVDIVPGKLSVSVHLHAIDLARGPIQCWSYVTEGFSALQQSELVFTLRCDPDEARARFPEDPLHLFRAVYSLAESGQRTDPGSITEFGARSLFGHHVLYVTAEPLPGLPLPPACLAALLITGDEVRAVRELGATRVLARLCHLMNYYPFPPWADRRRDGLSLERTFDESLLSKIARTPGNDVSVALAGKRITMEVLRLDPSPWRERLAQVPDGVPFALLTARDPSARGCLVWQPGQQQPQAIALPGGDGSPCCGCFIAFVPDQPTSSGRILEDGFVVELTGDAWTAIRRALLDGEEMSIAATGEDLSLALTWRDEVYVSPIDGRAHRASGGWSTYTPEQPGAATASDRVTIKHVRLLSSESEIAARTSASALAAFCSDILRSAEQALGDLEDGVEVLVQLRCTPHGHEVSLAARGGPPRDAVQALLEAIKKLHRLAVSDGEVSFEVHLSVSRQQETHPAR